MEGEVDERHHGVQKGGDGKEIHEARISEEQGLRRRQSGLHGEEICGSVPANEGQRQAQELLCWSAEQSWR